MQKELLPIRLGAVDATSSQRVLATGTTSFYVCCEIIVEMPSRLEKTLHTRYDLFVVKENGLAFATERFCRNFYKRNLHSIYLNFISL